MITEMMDYCKKHFIYSYEKISLEFKDTASVYTIEGAFTETYLAGQYIYITNSVLNNGAYLISAATSTKLTVVESVMAETATTYILGLMIPKSFRSLLTEISLWVTNQGGKDGIASESIDDYSVSFSALVQTSGWQGAFRGKLARYKSCYNDLYPYTGEA